MGTRVGMMTFLHNNNYGSILQAWSLQRAVTALGYEAVFLDYAPSAGAKLRNLLDCRNSPSLLADGLRKRLLRRRESGARARAEGFAAFRRERLTLSPRCADTSALAAESRACDVLLCGSDQIWSPVWLNPAYFLDFAGTQPKVCYAPSLGVSVLKDQAKRRRMTALLKDFERLSVREADGAALLRELTGRTAEVLPDPVFLTQREDWLRLAQLPEKRHYLLAYFIGERPDYWERVRAAAERERLDVVVIPVTAEAYAQPWQPADGLSPEAWLGWFAGAEAVVTDSFHGAAFSYLFGLTPEVLRRYREDDPASKNSRIDQLLRHMTTAEGETADDRLRALRERGMAYLSEALAEASSKAASSGGSGDSKVSG